MDFRPSAHLRLESPSLESLVTIRDEASNRPPPAPRPLACRAASPAERVWSICVGLLLLLSIPAARGGVCQPLGSGQICTGSWTTTDLRSTDANSATQLCNAGYHICGLQGSVEELRAAISPSQCHGLSGSCRGGPHDPSLRACHGLSGPVGACRGPVGGPVGVLSGSCRGPVGVPSLALL